MSFQGIPIFTHPGFNSFEKGTITNLWMDIVANGIGQDILVPVIVIRGRNDGPTMGVTAAVHGNELNGMSVIQRLCGCVDPDNLSGTLVGVPAVNIPSVLANDRRFMDGEDLNRIFPGKSDGNESQVYAHRIVERIIKQFDYHIDLHTASFGRVNSHYVRANMSVTEVARMAKLQDPDIILDAVGADGTLRWAAMELGIPSITVEVGDPDRFQKGMIRSGLEGILNVMMDLDMLPGEVAENEIETVHCSSSYWVYADRGGVMEVFPNVTDRISKGDRIAFVRDVFGRAIKEYHAPEDGIVIGKHRHPINQTGARIIHLGIINQDDV